MDKKKQAIVLLITIMVIMSIMSIIAVSFSYLDKARKDTTVTSAMLQADLFYGNSIDILKRFFPAGSNNSEKLEMIYGMPIMLNESKNNFTLTLTCQPLVVAPPIFWFNSKIVEDVPEKNRLIRELLENIVNTYNIQEPNRLEESIIQAVTGKSPENLNFEARIKPKRGISSKKQFDRLITDHFLKYDDAKVLTIPWENYFSFTEENNLTKIDGKYLSSEFLAMEFEIPIEIVQEWDRKELTLTDFLNENGVNATLDKHIYSKQALNAMHCNIQYTYKKQTYRFNFNYINGRSENFEFNQE